MAKKTSAKAVTPNNLQPMPGYVLVKPAVADKKTASGIYLPDSHDEKPQQGTVLAVGADWTTEHGAVIKTKIKVGDSVMYKKWGGNDVKIGDIEYQFLKFEDILAIVE